MPTYRCKISLALEEYVEDPPPPTPCDLHILKFMIMLTGCFTMGKLTGGEYSQIVGSDLTITLS